MLTLVLVTTQVALFPGRFFSFVIHVIEKSRAGNEVTAHGTNELHRYYSSVHLLVIVTKCIVAMACRMVHQRIF